MRLPLYECNICARVWKRETERMRQGKTCSKRCASIKGYLSGERKETAIELKIQEIARELGIEYVTQKPILGVTIADLFIAPNVAIFADGDYWHGSKKALCKDQEKTKTLERNQYIVLRLTETEILKNPEKTREKIKTAYNKRRAIKAL